MKKSYISNVFIALLCLLILPDFARATVSYWDPEGFRGTLNTFAGNLNGTWENNSWSRNSDGSAGTTADTGQPAPQAFTEGDAAVFAVGSGATNNVNGAGTNTTTFTVTVNNTHTIAGIFHSYLRPKSCRVTIDGTGSLSLASGFDAFNITTNAVDGSLGVVTVNVPLTGPGTLTAENNGGQIFLNASNSYAGGTQIGFSNITAFAGILNFNNSNAFGTGPIVISTGSSTTRLRGRCNARTPALR